MQQELLDLQRQIDEIKSRLPALDMDRQDSGLYVVKHSHFRRPLTPTQLTASVNNYDPPGWQDANVLRFTNDGLGDTTFGWNLTGLARGRPGRTVILTNTSGNNVTIKDESTSSLAPNRFALNADFILGIDEALLVWYDDIRQRWKIAGLGAHGVGRHNDRTGKILFPLGAAFRGSGTGALEQGSGLRLSLIDAESGGWRWQQPVPHGAVAGAMTLYWLWDTPATGAKNCRFETFVGEGSEGVANSGTNLFNGGTQDDAIDGTANIMQLSSRALTNPLSAVTRGVINITLNRLGAHANDTVSDVVYLRAIWLEYTADQ